MDLCGQASGGSTLYKGKALVGAFSGHYENFADLRFQLYCPVYVERMTAKCGIHQNYQQLHLAAAIV